MSRKMLLLLVFALSALSITAFDREQESAEPDHSIERASSWHLMDVPADHLLRVTHQGRQNADIWVYRRAEDGSLSDAVRVASDATPHAQIQFTLADLYENTDGAFFLASTAMLSLDGGESKEGTGPDCPAASKAETTRDERGVWHIDGGSLYDVMEAEGYNIATDRLWQAEIYRRTGTGRLAELFGQDLVSQDSLVRATGYSGEELDAYLADSSDDTKAMINGYVDGFNRRIAEVNADLTLLPFEFRALGMPGVSPWTSRDVMSWVALLQRNFSSLGNLGFGQVENGLFLLELVERNGGFVGVHMFADAVWRNDPQAPTMIPSEADLSTGKQDDEVSDLLALVQGSSKRAQNISALRNMVADYNDTYENNVRLLKEVGGFVKGGSYAWAVSGDKTASGNPTVYSGPQMGFSAPAIVTEGAIHSDTVTVSGMTVPGIPGIIIGRTPHHAWSMQVGHTNTWDFYVDSPEDVTLSHMETIHVAGGEDVQVPVYRTQHGPVVAQEPFVLSWKYSSWGREWRMAEGSLALARATSMDEFNEGISNLAVTQHFTYADRDGNIGYWMSGMNPVRTPGEYRIPQGLLGPALEWDADVLQPPVHDANTPQGFYAGWNNKARADISDTAGFYGYGQFHRAIVVQEWLRNHDNLTYEDIQQLAVIISSTDSFSSGGNIWNPVADAFKAAVAAHSTPARDAAIAMMEAWDGSFVAGGEENWIAGPDRADAWILIDRWVRNVIDMTFDDEMGNFGGYGLRFNMLLREMNSNSLQTNNYRRWFKNATGGPQTRNDIIVAGLDLALEQLGEQPWGIGQRGSIVYGHQFGFDLPTTPFASRSTYAHCVEYGPDGPVRVESMFPLGESGTILMDAEGNPVFDPHFFSMKPLFDSFTMRPFPGVPAVTTKQ